MSDQPVWHESVLDTIGNTPLVRLRRIAAGLQAPVVGKVEYFNPGNSSKDRVALHMIRAAEAAGQIRPGGTIVETTSGNTGMAVAMAASQLGYRAILCMSDKQSKEKVNILRALGAEVILCPAAALPDDPRSNYSVAKRIVAETPNSVYLNQYDNPANVQAHYETSGPELWRQTQGRITHFVCSMGTCGTIVGTARYLKEQNPNVQIIGVDAYGSTLQEAYHNGGHPDPAAIYPYLTEAVGKDFVPKNLDRSVIDQVVKVSDQDGALMTRRLAREESLLVGWSCGSATVAALDVARNLGPDALVVVLLADHGSRYLAKVFNDEWMLEKGLLQPEPVPTGAHSPAVAVPTSVAAV